MSATDGRLVNYSPRYVASLIFLPLQRPQLWTQFFPICNPRMWERLMKNSVFSRIAYFFPFAHFVIKMVKSSNPKTRTIARVEDVLRKNDICLCGRKTHT